jgi:hypothetical protein
MNAAWHRLWQRSLRRLGVPGLVGLALLAAALALVASAPSLTHRAEVLDQVAQARDAMLLATGGASAESSAQARWRQFSASFPARSQMAEDLRHVFAAAQRSDVSLVKGEYRIVTEANSPFVVYSMTFPVRESYTGIKRFTAEVLRSLPHAEMEELRLERGDAGAAALEARVRISLIYRAS